MSKTNKKHKRDAILKKKHKMTNASSIQKKKISNNNKRTNSKKNKNNKSINIIKKISLKDVGTNIAKKLQIRNNNKSPKMEIKKNVVQLINKTNSNNNNSVKKVQKSKNIREKHEQDHKINPVIAASGLTNKNTMKSKKGPKINIERLKVMLASKEKDQKQLKKVKEILPLRERMMMKLKASRFRYLNETLYNNSSTQSKKYFKEDPEAFTAYHEGYKQQVAQWPLNPLDVIIESIKNMPNDHIIADFGCGEALLATSVFQKVYSFDLISVNDRVQACDMAHTPLLMNSVHVVVFCLSLMGTNLGDYILEANRILKKDGILKIAEIESRFVQIEDFIKSLNEYGFVNTWKDLSQNLFYFLDFKKIKDIAINRNKLPQITLKSCVYKKR